MITLKDNKNTAPMSKNYNLISYNKNVPSNVCGSNTFENKNTTNFHVVI